MPYMHQKDSLSFCWALCFLSTSKAPILSSRTIHYSLTVFHLVSISQVCISKQANQHTSVKPRGNRRHVCTILICFFSLAVLIGFCLTGSKRPTSIHYDSLSTVIGYGYHRTCKLINKLADLDGAGSAKHTHTHEKMKQTPHRIDSPKN